MAVSDGTGNDISNTSRNGSKKVAPMIVTPVVTMTVATIVVTAAAITVAIANYWRMN